MVGDPLYALGVLRRSSVGLTMVIAGVGGGDGWKGRDRKCYSMDGPLSFFLHT